MRFLKTIPVLLVALLLVSCSDSTLPRRESLSSGFIPGKVMETMPVYPGVSPSQDFFREFGPSSIPKLFVDCAGPLCPGVQTASALYEIEATDNDIQVWYAHKLSAIGYREYGGGFGGVATTREVSTKAYYNSAEPIIGIQINVYKVPDRPTVTIDVLTFLLISKPKTSEQKIPDDVQQVTVTFPFRNNETHQITSHDKLERLVGLVNQMPVTPELTRFGPIGGCPQNNPETFQLTFKSRSRGDISINSWDDCGGYLKFISEKNLPLLSDLFGIVSSTLKELTGAKVEPTPTPLNALPVPPTPNFH